MKKQLLLALALTTVTAVGFAQSRTVSAGKRPVAIEDAASNGTTHSTIRRTPRPHSANRISTVVLTPIGSSSGNCYGGFVDNKHTFAYNADLNLLSFGHRGGGIAGNVGNQVNFDFSTDGGLTWTPQIALVNPQIGTYNTRYPNLNIWNPTGNTVLANAKAVFTGPCTNGTGWQSTYLASANYPAAANTTYDFQTAIPGTTPAMLDYASWSLTNLNGGMGYISARMDVAAQSQSYAAVDFWKIVPNGAGGFTRSIKFSSAPVACYLADTASFGFDVAFGPDGNTGYMTHITADLDSQNPQDYSHSPALYKTMDAGETWMKLPTLNLQAIQTLVDSTVDTRTAGTVRPVVSDTRLVVDNMGKCHIFAEISSGSSVCQDSTGFTWSGATSRYIMHLITDGTNYQSNFVYRTSNNALTFGALTNALNDQFQVSRSADGTRVFFTTLQTSPSGSDNSSPDLFAYAYRTTDSKFMPIKNMTLGTDAEATVFFPRLSPVSMTIVGGHRLPVVVMFTGAADTDPVEYNYLDGLDVLDADYTGTVGASVAAGFIPNGPNTCIDLGDNCHFINVEPGSKLEGLVNFMPNPTSGNLNVDLTKLTSAATVSVTDITGKQVRTLSNQSGNIQLDLAGQAAGIYFVTIRNNEGVLTAKIAVMK